MTYGQKQELHRLDVLAHQKRITHSQSQRRQTLQAKQSSEVQTLAGKLSKHFANTQTTNTPYEPVRTVYVNGVL